MPNFERTTKMNFLAYRSHNMRLASLPSRVKNVRYFAKEVMTQKDKDVAQSMKKNKMFWELAAAIEGEKKEVAPLLPDVYKERKAIYDTYYRNINKFNKEHEESLRKQLHKKLLATEVLQLTHRRLGKQASRAVETLIPTQRNTPTWTPPLKPLYQPKKILKDKFNE